MCYVHSVCYINTVCVCYIHSVCVVCTLCVCVMYTVCVSVAVTGISTLNVFPIANRPELRGSQNQRNDFVTDYSNFSAFDKNLISQMSELGNPLTPNQTAAIKVR